MEKGYIKLYRKSTENPLYFMESFTKWQAWVDLLILANHKTKFVSVRNIPVKLNRGQVLAGREYLADRWQWSGGKVIRFLLFLEKTVQQIVQQKNNITNVVTIINYNTYQANGTASSTADGQQTVQQTDTPKNGKNGKNGKKERKFIPPTIQEFSAYCNEDLQEFNINAENIFEGYAVADWHDSHGNAIKNWKQKLRQVWCKSENKQTPKEVPFHIQKANECVARGDW